MSAASHGLSLSSAIFINLNIMMGVGLFVNTAVLSQQLGAASIFIYPLIGLLTFPLIYTVSHLTNRFPAGGFYSFAKEISPFLGFISTWSYFFGKLASGGLMLYVACTILQGYFICLHTVPTLLLCFLMLLFFTLCNMYNMQVGAQVQKIFFTAKSIPVLFVILIGLYFFDTSGIIATNFHFEAIPFTIPLIIFCLSGFEAACSISRRIENPTVNGPRAIFYSFGIVITLYTLYQALLYLLIHPYTGTITSYQEIYPLLTRLLPTAVGSQQKIAALLNVMSAVSALGGSYGILFSNTWNMYTLAENQHVVFSKQFTRLNKNDIPFLIILLEAAMYMIFLLFTQGYQIPLQQTTAFGVTIAYTISAIAGLWQLKRKKYVHALAVTVCIGFIATCLYSLLQKGVSSLYLFLSIMLIGCLMFWYTSNRNRTFNNKELNV
jgi:amino acid transporter